MVRLGFTLAAMLSSIGGEVQFVLAFHSLHLTYFKQQRVKTK